MSTNWIHITNGDVAAESLRTALRAANCDDRNDRVLSLRDDLAVGALRGIDESPDVRAEFWQRVAGDSTRDLTAEFAEQLVELERVTGADSHVVIWHAESAADQLTLRRVCYHLRNSPQRLNEVRLSIRDLTDPGAWAHSRPDHATSVGMFAPDVLQAHLLDAAPISVLRISRLALEWQEVKQANGETRRLRDNTFMSGSFGELDAFLLAHTTDAWRPAARIAAELIVANVGFLVSDSIALWRCRELAASGRVQLRGDASSWRTLELCAADAPEPAALSICPD
ncbi:DUF1835 domain-containing protein [Paraburkholderia flava]|uniref:DUF1835 domain-containing protein n=1 Tax=Paraburkholderia flava TaxID=2547393 RepID=UPI0010620245|nr:DUF1835 domain-containing protein [Paraburkholderia flava]